MYITTSQIAIDSTKFSIEKQDTEANLIQKRILLNYAPKTSEII